MHHRRTLAALATLVWLLLWLPTLRQALEASMFRHMLMQLPLLAAIGWLWGNWLIHEQASAPARWVARIQFTNRWGATGLLVAIATMTLWMLPLALDSARLNINWEVAKFVSVPLLVGAAAALSWPRCPSLVRGVIHMEIVATFLRFGWGYWEIDQRLCLTYLLDDQQRAGAALCWLGAAWALAAVWQPLFGAPRAKQAYVS